MSDETRGELAPPALWSLQMKIVLSALLAAALFLAGALTPGYAQRPARPEVVKARVVAIDAARGKLTLDHAPIKSIKMEAMVMPFKVRDPAMLASLKAGDRVEFSVAVVDDELLITRIGAAK
jgi:Cu(I)/Ag(I) efflux system protein CusF